VTVTKHLVDKYGRLVGTVHKNPAFDTRKYEIELEDGRTGMIFANRIAANLYSQFDAEGRQMLAFREIVGHEKNTVPCQKTRDTLYTRQVT
jgi:hypothetical protein